MLEEVRLAGQLLLDRSRATHSEVHAAFGRYDARARPLLRSYSAITAATPGGGVGAGGDNVRGGDGGGGGGDGSSGVEANNCDVVEQVTTRPDGLVDILPDEEDVWLLSLRWHVASAWQRRLWNDGGCVE